MSIFYFFFAKSCPTRNFVAARVADDAITDLLRAQRADIQIDRYVPRGRRSRQARAHIRPPVLLIPGTDGRWRTRTLTAPLPTPTVLIRIYKSLPFIPTDRR